MDFKFGNDNSPSMYFSPPFEEMFYLTKENLYAFSGLMFAIFIFTSMYFSWKRYRNPPPLNRVGLRIGRESLSYTHEPRFSNIEAETKGILESALGRRSIAEIDDYDFDARKVLSGGVYPSTETVEDKASQTDESFPLISIDEAETFHHQFDDPIYAEDLEKIYIEKINGMEFTKEFTTLAENTKSIDKAATVAVLPFNAPKNRYSNIYPYDEARVKLSGGTKKDYINAAFIEGYDNTTTYIVTQGPVKNTIPDFWKMIWEYDVHAIVMLCKCIEKDKQKCEKYWAKGSYGSFKVNQDEKKKCGSIVLRTISVYNKSEKKTKVVIVFQYISWPDHGIPKCTTTVMYLRRLVNDYIATKSNAPIVVHCSAGAGRSGTYLAMDSLFYQLKNDQVINVSKMVYEFRLCRPQMVQTQDQYEFIYRLALERYIYPESDYSLQDFISATKRYTWENKVYREFKMFMKIPKFGHNKDRRKNGKISKLMKALPRNFPLCDFAPAVMEMPYFPSDLILCNIPAESDKKNFWQFVLDQNVICIVTLDEATKTGDLSEERKKTYEFSGVNVTCKNASDYDEFMIRTLDVFDRPNKKQIVLSHIFVKSWPDDNALPSRQFFDEIWPKIRENFVGRLGCKSIVCCNEQGAKSGLLIALISLIRRLRVEKRIDVFRTVKDLKEERYGIVDDFKTYQKIYSFVKAYADQFSPLVELDSSDEET